MTEDTLVDRAVIDFTMGTITDLLTYYTKQGAPVEGIICVLLGGFTPRSPIARKQRSSRCVRNERDLNHKSKKRKRG